MQSLYHRTTRTDKTPNDVGFVAVIYHAGGESVCRMSRRQRELLRMSCCLCLSSSLVRRLGKVLLYLYVQPGGHLLVHLLFLQGKNRGN